MNDVLSITQNKNKRHICVVWQSEYEQYYIELNTYFKICIKQNFEITILYENSFDEKKICKEVLKKCNFFRIIDSNYIYPVTLRKAKFIFDFFKDQKNKYDIIIFLNSGIDSYFCIRCKNSIFALSHATIIIDMVNCLEWKLLKSGTPIGRRQYLNQIERERICAELADIVLLEPEQALTLRRKGWNYTGLVFPSYNFLIQTDILHYIRKNNNQFKCIEMMNDALVSVVIPSYNRPNQLRSAVASVKRQTWRRTEIIVVDDGSTVSEMSKVLAELETLPEVRVIRQENGHAAAARNHGVRESHGEYIVFLDDDNTLQPDFIEVCFAALVTAGADVCIPGMFLHPGADIAPSVYVFEAGGGRDLMAHSVLENVYGDTCCLGRRNVFITFPFPETRAGHEDCSMYMAMHLAGKILLCWPVPLFHYYITEGSVSSLCSNYAGFRTQYLPLENHNQRSLALLGELYTFRNDPTLNISVLIQRELEKIPIIGGVIRYIYDVGCRRKTWNEAKAILHSGLFDVAWYHEQCPEAPLVPLAAAFHYADQGWRYGYSPGPKFDGAAYMEKHNAIKISGINPLIHYMRIGKKSGCRLTGYNKK